MIHEDENSDIYDTDSSADDEIELAQFINEEQKNLEFKQPEHVEEDKED